MKPTYKHLQFLNEMGDKLRKQTIHINYLRLGEKVFRTFAEEVKRRTDEKRRNDNPRND